MIEHVAIRRTTSGWEITLDSEDPDTGQRTEIITEHVVGWQVEPAGPANAPAQVWLAFAPRNLTIDGTDNRQP